VEFQEKLDNLILVRKTTKISCLQPLFTYYLDLNETKLGLKWIRVLRAHPTYIGNFNAWLMTRTPLLNAIIKLG